MEKRKVVSNTMETEDDERRTADILREFMDTTTAHGWGHAIRSRFSVIRALWILLTLTALACNVAHVSMLVSQYLQYPYEQVSLIKVDEIAFPSVSVCNIQSVSVSSMYASLNNPLTKFSQWNNTTNHFFNHMMNYSGQDAQSRQLYERLRGPRGFYENIGDEVHDIGHKAKDLVLSCLYSFQQCTWKNFSAVDSATYYNCYTFNGGNASEAKIVTQTTGPQAGLSLILYLESSNNDPAHTMPYYTFLNVGNAAGVRVVIHSPDTYPSPIDQGFDIPPGFSSSVGVEVKRHRRLGEPYSECESAPKIAHSDGNYMYSDHECTLSCQQTFVVSECSCVSAELPHTSELTNKFPYCGYFNTSNPADLFKRTACEVRTTKEFLTNEKMRKNCSCYAPCLEYEYDTDVSYSYWPVENTQKSFYDHYVVENPDRDSLKVWQNLKSWNTSDLISEGLIRKNFVRLNVYIESLVIQEYMQQGSYTFFNLFSDIGGTFGLWIGMSLLTWGEVIELSIRMLLRWIRKATGTTTSHNVKSTQAYQR